VQGIQKINNSNFEGRIIFKPCKLTLTLLLSNGFELALHIT